jgi:hypothetical protein
LIIDGFFLFTGTSNGASGGITSTANTDAPTTGTQDSSNIVDIGIKSGIPASIVGGGGGGARDLGIGDKPALKVLAQVTTAFTGGTSLQVLLQGAPDNGSGAPGTWTALWASNTIAEANLTVGSDIANVFFPQPEPGQPLPRFIKMTFVTVGTHTAGQIEGAVVLDQIMQIMSATGALSGYPAGLNVAN